MKIFYSWQGPHDADGRRLIQDALFSAAAEGGDWVDQDTRKELGSVDIPAALFAKIASCDLFVADVSLVFEQPGRNPGDVRKSPNPNVLIELGYAAHAIGWSRIVTVMDSGSGKQEELPFDIRHRRVVSFALSDLPVAQKELTKLFARVIADTNASADVPIVAWQTASVEQLTSAALRTATDAMKRVELAKRDTRKLARGDHLTYAVDQSDILAYFVGRFVREHGAYALAIRDELARRTSGDVGPDPLKLTSVDELESFAHHLQRQAFRLKGPDIR